MHLSVITNQFSMSDTVGFIMSWSIISKIFMIIYLYKGNWRFLSGRLMVLAIVHTPHTDLLSCAQTRSFLV